MRLLTTTLLCLAAFCRLDAQKNSPLQHTAAAPKLSFEICDNGLDDDGDGYVDCYDPDCNCYPAMDCSGLAPEQFAARLAWKSKGEFYSWQVSPLVANLNPWADEMPEIIIVKFPTNTIHIYRGDGANAQQPDAVQVSDAFSIFAHNQLAIGDLDGDGRPELVVVDKDGFVNIFQNYTPGATPAMQLWLKSEQPAESSLLRPQLADFNGDGIAEIYVGNAIFKLDMMNPGNLKLNKVLDANGPEGLFLDAPAGSAQCALTVADLLSVADCNGDPDCAGLELAAGNRIWSVDLDPFDGDPMQIKPARTLSSSQWGDGYTAVNDVDADGIPDLIVNSVHKINGVKEFGLYVWDKNGLKYFLPNPVQLDYSGGGLPCIANIIDDRELGYAEDLPEILVMSEYKLTCFNLNKAQTDPLAPWWWSIDTDDPSGYTACTVFDLNGDGRQEIIFRDERYLRILYGGLAPFPAGVDSNRNWWFGICGSGTITEYPVVADVDHDGQAEIVLTGQDTPYSPNSGLSYLRVYESAGMPWMPARPLWNQFNYNSVQINDDFSIPAQPQPHWLEFPAPGSGKRPLNIHLAQAPLLNKNFEPAYPVADGAISVDSFYVDAQYLYLRLRLCNTGDAPLSDSMPVQFYLDDPTTAVASPYSDPVFLVSQIEAGACKDFTVQIPLPPPGVVFGLLNDRGDEPTPLSLSTDDFQPAVAAECRYENNLFSITVSEPDMDTVCDVKTPPGCLRYELLGIRLDQSGQRRYRVRVTNACASPLDYVCLQLPKGVAAAWPGDGAAYTASDGNAYTVRNPNASPFYSIRFKAQTGGLQNGQQAVFEYALPQQSAPAYIHVYGKLANGSASEAHLNTFYCPVQAYAGSFNRNAESPVFTPGFLQLWPNPSNGYLLIDGPGLAEQPSRIRVLNTQGQVVYETRFDAGSTPARVDLPESLANGMYYLSVDGAEWVVLRFVLAR